MTVPALKPSLPTNLLFVAALALAACGAPQQRTNTTGPGTAPAASNNSSYSARASRPAAAPQRIPLAALVGQDGAGLDSLLGAPELVRRDNGAEVRLYRHRGDNGCVLYAFLYPQGTGLRANHVEARRDGARLSDSAGQACVDALRSDFARS